MSGQGFSERVRQELARQPTDAGPVDHAELAALVRFAGTLTLSGGEPPHVGLTVETRSGAVVRRAYRLTQHRFGLRPELSVRMPGGVRTVRSYQLRLTAGASQVAQDLEIVDAAGRPVEGLPAGLAGPTAIAFLRGAILAAGSVSSPGRAPHLEITANSPVTARGLADLAGRVLGQDVHVTTEERPRVVLKSGERIGELLAAVGASQAFLTWDDQRLRRQLRGDATRLANADGANLRRSIEASAAQVAAVERAIGVVGWSGLDEELRAIALARLANPEASLAELGELVDPPVGKSAVHRRLRRLAQLAAGSEDPVEGGASGP